MDIPAATPVPFGHQQESDILPQPSAPLAWISFGGGPHESTASFVQSIQRTAFQHNRISDDRWIAQYASTCFSGNALEWFLELEEDVQESWKRLRIALVRRFPQTPKLAELSNIGSPEPELAVTAPGPVPIMSSSLSTKQGRIEVVGPLASTLGYLAFDPSSGISITPSEAQAVIVTLPDPVSSDPCHIQMVGLPMSLAAFPFLGLVQYKYPDDQDSSIPAEIHIRFNNQAYCGEPVLPATCKSKRFKGKLGDPRPKLATWELSNCGKSRSSISLLRKSATPLPNSRATAAVWLYGGKNEDLAITLLMDNKEECELGAFVHQGSFSNLHVHRIKDVPRSYCLDEVRVDLVIKFI